MIAAEGQFAMMPRLGGIPIPGAVAGSRVHNVKKSGVDGSRLKDGLLAIMKTPRFVIGGIYQILVEISGGADAKSPSRSWSTASILFRSTLRISYAEIFTIREQ